jgi:transposase-like protein
MRSTDGGHHLEGARIDEIAHQHAGLVAEHALAVWRAAAQRGLVDDVVVQQRGGVDELDDCRELEALRTVEAERSRTATRAWDGCACRRRR